MQKTFYASIIRAAARRASVLRLLILTSVLALGTISSAWASHFRYGSITWRTVNTDPTKRTIEFKVSQAWRHSAFGNPVLGSTISTDAMTFGDGSSAQISLRITSVDAVADNFYGEAIIRHTYAANGSFVASVNDCCRIGGLQNNNGGSFYQSTLVTPGLGNSSPVSTMPPIVYLATNQSGATFQLASSDPDGDALTYSLASSTDMNGYSVNPSGLSINPTTGVATFNTSNVAAGTLYSAILKVSDGKTAILVDFLIQVTRVSAAPQFDYSITPTNGYVYQVAPGTPVTFGVRATDSDAGDVVRLQAIGLPPGAVMSPALPVTGNPVSSTFSWTPTLSTLGTSVISFVAQDAVGVQKTTSVTIQVSTKPTFDVPPTPSNGTVLQITPGTPISQLVQVSSIDPSSPVRILSATGLPAAASYAPTLPTAAANPTSTTLSWTPAVADWGLHTVTFTAANSYDDRKTHSLQYIVNSAPVFLSTPTSLNVVAGRPFHYDVVTTDPDLAYGDELEIEYPGLPAWLTLTDNGDGTASLDGTPTVAEAGANPVTLVAADIYHHGASYGLVTQAFSINVIPCSAQALAQNVTLLLDANGQATLTAAQVDNGSTATCGVASLTVAPASFNCSNLGANPVVLTLTDTYGNVSTAPATVFVVDTTLPTLTAPAAVVVSTDAGQCSATNVALGTAVVADNCSATVTNNAPATFAKGTTTVTWTAVDASGNQIVATQTVTVNDTELPTISAPAAVVASTDANQCSASGLLLGRATAGDNCTGVVVSNDAPATFAKGVTTVTWTATDASGNVATATQNVTVNDTQLPVITVPASVVVSTDAGQCSASGVALGTATAVDNCSGVMVRSNAPATFAKGATTVIWTATDAAGNVATATQTVIVNDTEKPVLTVPANITANAAASQCGAVVSFAPTATDNCAGATVVASPASGSTFPVGTSTVAVTATDASGNTSTGSFTVTVRDVTAPAVAVRNVSVALSNGAATVTAAQVNNGSTDACGIASVVLSRTSFDCSNIGANNVTLTVTDIHGNVASAPAVVTVTGSIPTPAIVATPSSVYVGGRPTIYLGYGSQTATLTASGGVSYQWAAAPGLSNTSSAAAVFTPTAEGMYTFTVTATSASGCTATASVKVYVEDVRCGSGNNDKITICHNGHEICVSTSALNTHLAHGDKVGMCSPPARPAADAATALTAAPLQAFPNPLTERTTITFRPEVSAPAQVRVFDAVGRQVATLFDGTTEAGRDYSLSLDASPLAAGIYLCRYESQGRVQTQRLSVVK